LAILLLVLAAWNTRQGSQEEEVNPEIQSV
jgi:hypothetical protein